MFATIPVKRFFSRQVGIRMTVGPWDSCFRRNDSTIRFMDSRLRGNDRINDSSLPRFCGEGDKSPLYYYLNYLIPGINAWAITGNKNRHFTLTISKVISSD